MDSGSYEKICIRESAASLKKYGSTSRHVSRNENYVKHYVTNTDTLQGIALRYNVTIEKIRRINKLWASDSLFLREYLLIPGEGNQEQTGQQTAPTENVTSPMNSSFDCDEDIDEFLNKIDASIATTKEGVKKTSRNSEFSSNVSFDVDRRKPATSRMKQMVNNNVSNDSFQQAHSVVVQQGRKVKTSLKEHEQEQDRLFEL